ncbi:MAG: hypothetical protein MZV70_41805 [Desulfobacterales bacterium]|nr:hypothetical protein [Desulfobacterales bacterium]
MVGIPLAMRPGPAALTVSLGRWRPDGSAQRSAFVIRPGTYGEETLTVDPRHVRPSPQDLERIRREQAEVRSRSTPPAAAVAAVAGGLPGSRPRRDERPLRHPAGFQRRAPEPAHRRGFPGADRATPSMPPAPGWCAWPRISSTPATPSSSTTAPGSSPPIPT